MGHIEQLANNKNAEKKAGINQKNPDFLEIMLLEVLKDEICEENLFALECIRLSYAKRGYVNQKIQKAINSYKEYVEKYNI